MNHRPKEQAWWPAACARFETWASVFQPGQLTRIDRRLAHKDHDDNVLIARVEQLQGDVMIGEMAQDVTHPFFYEHDLDHVPGLYLIEAGRQFGAAACHLFYGVDFGIPFVLDACNASFSKMVEKDLPAFFVTETYLKQYADDGSGRLTELRMLGSCVQEGRDVGTMDASFRFFEPKRYHRMVQARRQLRALRTAADTD